MTFDYRDTIARRRLASEELQPLGTFVEGVEAELEQNDGLTAAKAEEERWAGWTESELREAFGK